jgi:hypothetical protein
MSIYAQDFFVIKKSSKFFGHLNYHSKPIVFAFRKERHVEKVKECLLRSQYEIDDHNCSSYKVIFHTAKGGIREHPSHEIDVMGYYDLSIHLSINNVEAHIVDDIIEDDEANMHFVNHSTSLGTVFVNDSMRRMYFNRLIGTDTSSVNES